MKWLKKSQETYCPKFVAFYVHADKCPREKEQLISRRC